MARKVDPKVKAKLANLRDRERAIVAAARPVTIELDPVTARWLASDLECMIEDLRAAAAARQLKDVVRHAGYIGGLAAKLIEAGVGGRKGGAA